jgi:hypothetical protein
MSLDATSTAVRDHGYLAAVADSRDGLDMFCAARVCDGHGEDVDVDE